ncbi:MAG: hypothetical protein V1695_02940 [Candidatus Uhrbacteria bacterium]
MDIKMIEGFCDKIESLDLIEFEIERNGNGRIKSVVVINKTRSVAMRVSITSRSIAEDRMQLIILRQMLEMRIERKFMNSRTLILDEALDKNGIILPEAHNRMAGDPFAKDQEEIKHLHKLFFAIKPKPRTSR